MSIVDDLFGHNHHHCDRPWDEAPPYAIELREMLRLIIRNQEKIMIDTSRILTEVARERTELASWKALSGAKDKVIADQAAALATAIAANDPAAIAKVQADLDQAATDLKNDNDDAEAAIAANVSPAPAGG